MGIARVDLFLDQVGVAGLGPLLGLLRVALEAVAGAGADVLSAETARASTTRLARATRPFGFIAMRGTSLLDSRWLTEAL